MRAFIRCRSLIKPSKGHASTATSVDPRGAMPRPISLADRSRTQIGECAYAAIIYTAIVFRQVMPRLMSPRVPMRALHKGARGCAPREIHGCIRCTGLDLEVTTLVRKTKSSIPAKGNAGHDPLLGGEEGVSPRTVLRSVAAISIMSARLQTCNNDSGPSSDLSPQITNL